MNQVPLSVEELIIAETTKAISNLYGLVVKHSDITLSETKPEFEGDYTVVTFSLTRLTRQSPEQVSRALGEAMQENNPGLFTSYNTIKGFLNLVISDEFYVNFLDNAISPDFGRRPLNERKVMVEFSSPNTNKPLHLGHLRNNFLGQSISRLFAFNGFDVLRTCVVNDRGVHICKSMLAWQKFASGKTPTSTGMKGDHFVGDYYVKFEQALQEETRPLLANLLQGQMPDFLTGDDRQKAAALVDRLNDALADEEKKSAARDALKELARQSTPLMQQVRNMLLRWEEGDAEILDLWRQMNGWVYDGFHQTYQRIGTQFDITYYESDTYLLGKQYVEEGLKTGVFYQKPDGSVWIDLQSEGLDEKLLLRRDGTSVYITQDIGLAQKKYSDFPMQQSIYVIGDEQNYHMEVLKHICKKLKMPFADGIYHLSYGMVDLPTGRMKSREGTVVDADDLCDEMEKVAETKTRELGKVDDFTPEELQQLYHTLGMGALKFYLLRVDPKKRMVFNPEESIDFHGFTGPFVQYTYARIKSVLRKAEPAGEVNGRFTLQIAPLEKKVLYVLERFPTIVAKAAEDMNPALVANYVFDLAKKFNAFYAEHSINRAETEEVRVFRLRLAQATAQVLASGLGFLGIDVPERM